MSYQQPEVFLRQHTGYSDALPEAGSVPPRRRNAKKREQNSSSHVTRIAVAVALFVAFLAIVFGYPASEAPSAADYGSSSALSPTGASVASSYSPERVERHLANLAEMSRQVRASQGHTVSEVYPGADTQPGSGSGTGEQGTSDAHAKAEAVLRVKELTRRYEDLERRREALQDDHRQIHEQYSALVEQHKNAVRIQQSLFEQLESAPEAIADLQTGLRRMNESRAAVNAQVTALDEAILANERSQEETKTALAELNAERVRAHSSVHNLNQRVTELQSQLTSLQDDQSSHQSEVASVGARKEECQRNLGRLREKINDVEVQLSAQEERKAGLEAQIGERTGVLEELERVSKSGEDVTSLTTRKEERIVSLSAKVKSIREELGVRHQEEAPGRDSHGGDTASEGEGTGKGQDAVRNAKEVVRWAKQREVRKLEQEIETLRGEIDYYRVLGTHRDTEQVLRKETKELREQLGTVKEQANALEASLKRAKQSLHEESDRLAELSDFEVSAATRNQALVSGIQSLKEQIRVSNTTLQETKKELTGISESIEEKNALLEQQKEANTGYRESRREKLHLMHEKRVESEEKEKHVMRVIAEQEGVYYDLVSQQEIIARILSDLEVLEKGSQEYRTQMQHIAREKATITEQLKTELKLLL